MPNLVDVSRTAELFATFTNNPVVVCFVGGISAVYLLVVVWARRKDIQDSAKVNHNEDFTCTGFGEVFKFPVIYSNRNMNSDVCILISTNQSHKVLNNISKWYAICEKTSCLTSLVSHL